MLPSYLSEAWCMLSSSKNSNYREIGITSLPYSILENIINTMLLVHLGALLSPLTLRSGIKTPGYHLISDMTFNSWSVGDLLVYLQYIVCTAYQLFS